MRALLRPVISSGQIKVGFFFNFESFNLCLYDCGFIFILFILKCFSDQNSSKGTSSKTEKTTECEY